MSRILPRIEAALEPWTPRPHWGKLFTLPADKLEGRYALLADFKALAARSDARGKFRNEFLDKNLYAS